MLANVSLKSSPSILLGSFLLPAVCEAVLFCRCLTSHRFRSVRLSCYIVESCSYLSVLSVFIVDISAHGVLFAVWMQFCFHDVVSVGFYQKLTRCLSSEEQNRERLCGTQMKRCPGAAGGNTSVVQNGCDLLQ